MAFARSPSATVSARSSRQIAAAVKVVPTSIPRAYPSASVPVFVVGTFQGFVIFERLRILRGLWAGII
jgi:hypothetical protein